MTEHFEHFDGSAEPDEPSIGEEVTRLVTVVQDWAARTFPPPTGAGHTGADCQWCPICQFMAVVRGERPEVTERVADAGTALVSAFRAFADVASAGAAQAGAHRHADAGREGDAAPRPRVQRIDLGADDPPVGD